MGRSWGILLFSFFFLSFQPEAQAFDRIVGTLFRAQVSEGEVIYRIGWGAANLLDDQEMHRDSSQIICQENSPEKFWSDCFFYVRNRELVNVADFEQMIASSKESLTWSEAGFISVGNPEDASEPLLRRFLMKGSAANKLLTDLGIDPNQETKFENRTMACVKKRIRPMTRSGPSLITTQQWRCEADVRDGRLQAFTQ